MKIQIVQLDKGAITKEHNDCTVCALSNTSGLPYYQAHKIAKDAGRKMRRGFQTVKLITHCINNLNMPFKRLEQKPMTIAKFIQMFPVGIFYVRRSGHAFAIINGVVVDHLDEEYNTPRKRITHAWQFIPGGSVEHVPVQIAPVKAKTIRNKCRFFSN